MEVCISHYFLHFLRRHKTETKHQRFSALIENLEKELVTPPLNGLILPGIVRDSVLHLARQWGDCKVTEKTITMDQVCKLIKEERVSSLHSIWFESGKRWQFLTFSLLLLLLLSSSY